MTIENDKKRDYKLKIIFILIIFLIVSGLIFLIIWNNINIKNTNSNNQNNNTIIKKINVYLDNLVEKKNIENSVYFSNTDSAWKIDTDKFEKTYLNYFFLGVKNNYIYNFNKIAFSFSFQQTKILIAETKIDYKITLNENNIISNTIINYEWDK